MSISLKQLMVIFIFCVPVAASSAAQTLQYSVDLRKYGCPSGRHTRLELSAGTTNLSFDSAGKVYVGCVIQGEARLLKHGEVNNIFRVLTIEPEKGKVIRKLDFPTQSKERTGLNITANGQLIVTADDKVQLVDEDGSVTAIFQIPIDGMNQILNEQLSASRKTFLVLVYGVSGSFPYFFRANTLSLAADCHISVGQYERDYPTTIADSVQMKNFRSTYAAGDPVPQNRLVMGPFCSETKNLWTVDSSVVPFLLDDSTVLEIGRSEQVEYTSVFEVRRTDAGVLWVQQLPKYFLAGGGLSTTEDGGRFAIKVDELKGGHPTLDISAKTASSWIWVFNAKTGKRMASIQVPANDNVRYALGPNGGRVAILAPDGGTLDVWRTEANAP